MTAPPDPPPSKAGLATGILDRLLGYMATPWKALVIILIMVLGGLGWAFWQERMVLEKLLLARGGLEIHVEDVPDALAGLLAQTTIDVATVWTLEFDQNAARFLGGRQRSGEVWVFLPKRLPILQPDSRADAFLKIISGQSDCRTLPTEDGGIMMKRLATEGMTRVCAVPIGHVGAFIVAWRSAPEYREERAQIGVTDDFASTLLKD